MTSRQVSFLEGKLKCKLKVVALGQYSQGPQATKVGYAIGERLEAWNDIHFGRRSSYGGDLMSKYIFRPTTH